MVESTPNHLLPADGFYISFNSVDADIYGSETTALVLGQMEKFYILNGDHRKQYQDHIGGGFAACLQYFRKNAALVNKYSDTVPPSEGQ